MFKKFYKKIRESFQTAVVAAFIVLMVILLLYIPFKIIPKIMTSGTSFIATTISSLFIPNEEDEENTRREETEDDDEDDVDEEDSTINTPTTKTQTPKYYGKADLSIRLIGVGIIDRNTGQFYQTNSTGLNEIVGIKFEVKNIGTNISGIWRLRLVMPSKTTPNHDSDYQISLRPGDRIEYVTGFENPIEKGINNGYIVADYFNNIDELTKTNNYLTVPISIVTKNSTDYKNIKISCGANVESSRTNTIVTWSASVSGGIGQYLYSWSGSDGLLSIQSPYNGINKIYYDTGTKTARVTVNINGQIISKDCDSIRIR
ncbi:MAG: CARDB domain-containing protein [Candidatus Pacebacteria bacterium]|nr:CARDB domain-containing protein [Candidatus Paceibacterota bacterium]